MFSYDCKFSFCQPKGKGFAQNKSDSLNHLTLFASERITNKDLYLKRLNSPGVYHGSDPATTLANCLYTSKQFPFTKMGLLRWFRGFSTGPQN